MLSLLRSNLSFVVSIALSSLACSGSNDSGPPSPTTDTGAPGDSTLDSSVDSTSDSWSDAAIDGRSDAVATADGEVSADAPTVPACTLAADADVPGVDPAFVAGARPLAEEARVETAHAMLDGHGGYIVFGRSYVRDGGGYDYTVMAHRYDGAGNLDTAFGNAAVDAFLGRGQQPLFHAGLIDDAGGIVLVGEVRTGSAPYVNSTLIMRLQSTGAIDGSFGGASGAPAGTSITRPSDCAGRASANHVVQLGGAIYIEAACVTEPGGSGIERSRIFRVDDGGTVDATYAASSDHGRAMLVSGGALFIRETTYVARLASDGALDTSFSTGGKWMPADGGPVTNMIATDDGGVLVASRSDGAGSTIALVRLDHGGAVEAGFTANYDYERIPVLGHAERCDRHFVLPIEWGLDGTKWSSAHLLANGAFDPAWSAAGVESAITLFAQPISTPDFVVDPNGGVLVVGVADAKLWMGRYH